MIFCCAFHKNYYNHSAKLDSIKNIRYNGITIKTFGGTGYVKATPHKTRLMAWRHIYLQIFRHLAQKFFAGRQPSGVISIQSDEKFDCASVPPSLCGVVLTK